VDTPSIDHKIILIFCLKVFTTFDRQDTAMAKKKHYSTITPGRLADDNIQRFFELAWHGGRSKKNAGLAQQTPDIRSERLQGDLEKSVLTLKASV
jgi:hypothetical protein